ncbi:MAG: hypothetical protein CMN28_07505 [Salinisphaeraceae bacterium]|nr:hypothetical protein [Salinisphaeraceae bacterium]
MLSRLANNLYWAGRYVERAENTARLMGVTTYLLLDLPRQTQFDWAPLVEITATEPLFRERNKEVTEQSVIEFLTLDCDNPGAVISSLAFARENLRVARDLVPREVWEEVNGLYHALRDLDGRSLERRSRQAIVERIVRSGRLVAGLLDSGMSRDASYRFFKLGESLERADMTTRILDVRSEDLLTTTMDGLRPFETIQWMSVLKSLSGYQMYRRHERTRVSAKGVLRFLLQNEDFPRAVLHCLDRFDEQLKRLPENGSCRRGVRVLRGKIQSAAIADLVDSGMSEFIDWIQGDLIELDQRLHATYFGR